MKPFITILTMAIVMLFMSVYTDAQQYHPFPEKNAFWTVVEYVPGLDQYKVFIYTIKGDSVINGKHYKKIWKLDYEPDTQDTLWYLHSFIRQDTIQKKVWFIRRYMDETTEKLGYDFDVEIGDTVYLPAFDYANTGDSGFVVIEPLWDSTLLRNGEYRRNYSYLDLNGGFNIDAIEGVGTHRTPFPNLFYFDPFHQNEVTCHKVNDVYIYGSDPQPNECGFWLDVKETMAVGTVKIKPNPCDSYVDILFPDNNNSDLEIKMINSFGRIVLQQNVSPQTKELRLNTSAYSNGIYIIYTSAKNGDFFINKIFIKH